MPTPAMAFHRFRAFPILWITVSCFFDGAPRASMYAENIPFVGSIGATINQAFAKDRTISRASSMTRNALGGDAIISGFLSRHCLTDTPGS